jgi:hypothetical protein
VWYVLPYNVTVGVAAGFVPQGAVVSEWCDVDCQSVHPTRMYVALCIVVYLEVGSSCGYRGR